MVQCSAAALRAAEGDEEGGGRVKISGHVEDSAERLDSEVTWPHFFLQLTFSFKTPRFIPSPPQRHARKDPANRETEKCADCGCEEGRVCGREEKRRV